MVQLYLAYRLMGCVPVINMNLDDNHSMANNNLQYVLRKTAPLQYTPSMKSIRNGGSSGIAAGGGEIIGINGKRIATKSCSDSSVDGRSSDSTYTSSSGGNGSLGRFARQSINSRFPTMERGDTSGNYLLKQSHKTPYSSMAYMPRNQVHFNSTYPKVNYTVQQRKHNARSNRSYYTSQDTFDESSFGEECSAFAKTYAGGGGATVEQTHHGYAAPNSNSSRRFVNVQKFIQSNKTALQSQSIGNSVAPSPVNGTPPVTPQSQTVLESTPQRHVKPITFDDHNGNAVETWSNENVSRQATPKEEERQRTPHENERQMSPREDVVSHDDEMPVGTPKTTLVATMQSSPNGVDLNSSLEKEASPVLDTEPPDGAAQESPRGDPAEEAFSEKEISPETPRPGSTISKVESMKLDDAQSTKSENMDPPPESQPEPENTADTPDYESQAVEVVSRPQSVISMKSQVIEEELDCEPSIIEPDRTSEVTQEVLEDLSDVEDNNPSTNVPSPQNSPIKELPIDPEPEVLLPITPDMTPSPPKSPTIAEIKALSRKSSFAKSNESLYERPQSKLDMDNSTETSSDYQPSHLNNTLTDFIPVKPQHIPLQRKSKTSCFMKNHRRISPVKQSIKMTQAELFPQNMTRFDKPRDALNKTFDQLDSPNWEVMVMGLKSMVRLMRYHPDTLDNQMHMTCIQLTKSVRNLRSQVSRAACQASTELFTMKSKFLEQECDDLVSALLHRTADTNRFLRADAARGLESMCDNLTPPKVLNILSTRGAVHQNALVRTTTAKLLNRLADRLGCDKIFAMGRDNRDKFIVTGANLLLEGSLETRSYAKSLFRMLSDHPNYTRLLQEVIPSRTYRNIEKTLKNIR